MNLIIFAESGIKSQNKAFFEEIEENYGTIQAMQSFDESFILPKVVFFQNLNIAELKETPDILYLELKGHNLSFNLDNKRRLKNHFKIETGISAQSLHLLFENYFSHYQSEIRLALKSDSQTILKGFKKSLKDFFPSTKLKEDLEELSRFVWDNFNIQDELELSKKVSRYFESLKFTTYSEFLKSNQNDFIWLSSFKGSELGLSFKMKTEELEARFLLLELSTHILFICNFLLSYEQKISGVEKEICNLVNKPFAVLSDNNDLVLYNDEFKDLSISAKKLIEAQKTGNIKVLERSFVVNKENFEFSNKTFTFFLFEEYSLFLEKATQPSSQELGIITSSIAHELNNPLAGILAALEVMALDIEEEHLLLEIEEMKKTVIRCKRLVETFLGFSKAVPLENKGIELSPVEAFEQAIDLLRFRLIESNLKMNTIKEVQSDFEPTFNQSILTMLYYLVLGEVVTMFGHKKLVENNASTQLEFTFKVFSKKLELIISHFDVDLSEISSKKLFEHLIDTLHCDVELKTSKIILKFL